MLFFWERRRNIESWQVLKASKDLKNSFIKWWVMSRLHAAISLHPWDMNVKRVCHITVSQVRKLRFGDPCIFLKVSLEQSFVLLCEDQPPSTGKCVCSHRPGLLCSLSTDVLPLIFSVLLTLHRAHQETLVGTKMSTEGVSSSLWLMNWKTFDSQLSIICKRLANLLGKLLPLGCIPTIQEDKSRGVRDFSFWHEQRSRKINL